MPRLLSHVRSRVGHASRAAAALIAFAGFGSVPAVAADPPPPIAVRVTGPGPVSYDATALGRASRALRILVSNPAARALALVPFTFRFRPVRDGVAFSCDEPSGESDRWPASLAAGASFTVSRDVSCETPLPGHYDFEVRGRPRGAPEADERSFPSFPVVVEPGPNPPVPLPWEPSIHAAASATRELRPIDRKDARVVIAMINGSKNAATLGPLAAQFHVTRRGAKLPPCDHTVNLAFSGQIQPGHVHPISSTLGCDVSAEAVYDVDIAVTNASGARVKLASQAIRVGVLPPPPPRPEDTGFSRIQGGM